MMQAPQHAQSRLRRVLAGALLAFVTSLCLAQQADENRARTSARGTTDTVREITRQFPGGNGSTTAGSGIDQPIATPPIPPQDTPTDAATLLGAENAAREMEMFGEQLFRPGVVQDYGPGLNPDYVLAIGDRVALRMWGAFTYEAMQVVDPQGNVFLPNVGPVRLAGVRNSELNEVVRAAVRRVYRNNVDVYASLEASQPVRVFVTGFVRAPGQFPGVAADSILGFLARAGGIDPERGSYIDVRLLRGGQERARFNLYDFLLEGRLEPVQLHDGDTLVVAGRHNAVHVKGDVFNPYGFEFMGDQIAATELLRLARPKPGATHVSIVRKVGLRQTGEYHPIERLEGVMLSAGDELAVVTDRSVETILVRVDGAIESSRVLTLPFGARLRDALALITPKPQARMEALQLYRVSVAQRQKEMLEVSLRVLETAAFTARSATSEESSLRSQEAALVTRFIERARAVEPRGQVVLGDRSGALDMLLEDGDVLYIPERTSVVMVHGEVTLPNAIVYDRWSRVRDYVRLAGGPTQRSAYSRILLLRQDGTVEHNVNARPEPGDEILVLPKVGTRNVEVARGITQILYQIAIAAKVALDL